LSFIPAIPSPVLYETQVSSSTGGRKTVLQSLEAAQADIKHWD